MNFDTVQWKLLDPDFDVFIGQFGRTRQDRMLVIRSASGSVADTWHQVPRTRVIIIGDTTLQMLKRIMRENGRVELNKRTGDMFSGTTDPRIRRALGLSKSKRPKPSGFLAR